MERGFYINQNNEIVFCGNRKPVDPDNLTWVEAAETKDVDEVDEVDRIEWPDKLMKYGVFTSMWDGSNVVENPAMVEKLAEIESEKVRLSDAEDEKELSGLRKLTVSAAHSEIDNMFKGAKTPEQIKNATIKALKVITVHLLK